MCVCVCVTSEHTFIYTQLGLYLQRDENKTLKNCSCFFDVSCIFHLWVIGIMNVTVMPVVVGDLLGETRSEHRVICAAV